jgi:hypothetical protein
MSVNDPIECKIHLSQEELENLREVWERLNHNPNADIDYYKALISSSDNNVRPCILTIWENNSITALLIGRLEKRSINITIGYKTFFAFELDSLTIIYGGILGELRAEILAVFFEKINQLFSEKVASMVFVNFVDDRGIFFELVERWKTKSQLMIFGDKNLHWKMQCPESMDNYYKAISYKFRKNLNRARRKLNNSQSQKVNFRNYTQKEEVDIFLELAEAIAQKSYQRGIGVGFVKSQREESLTRIAANKGWMSSYVLFVNDSPIAFERIYNYKGTLYCQDAAYDPKFRSLEAGTNLFLHIVEQACQKKEIKEIDFGFGDAEYKRRFGSTHWCERQLYMFDKSLKNYFIYFLFNITRNLNSKLKAYSQKMGIMQTIKREWRKILTPKNSNVN